MPWISRCVNDPVRNAENANVDFTCLVFSRAAATHERVAVEILRALELENGQGALVLPLLIESVTLPTELAGRRCAVFTSGYESGLADLLPTFGRIAVLPTEKFRFRQRPFRDGERGGPLRVTNL